MLYSRHASLGALVKGAEPVYDGGDVAGHVDLRHLRSLDERVLQQLHVVGPKFEILLQAETTRHCRLKQEDTAG